MSIPYAVAPGLEADVHLLGEPSALRLASRRHQTWQSAMEQAQLAGWFKPGQGNGEGLGQLREQADASASALASPSWDREAPGVSLAEGTGQSAQAPIPRSVSSLAVSQALHAAGLADLAPPVGSGTSPEMPLPDVPGGAVIEGVTLQLAARVWRQIEASIPATTPQTLGMALPAGQGAVLRQALQGEPVAAGHTAQRLPPPDSPRAAMVASFGAPLTGALPAVVAVQEDAAQDDVVPQAEEPVVAAQPGASRLAASLPPGQAPDDETATAMRVHVDWSEQGASVWLGVHNERLVSLPALARQLDQWFLASGVKLASLVCNGRTISTCFSQRRSG